MIYNILLAFTDDNLSESSDDVSEADHSNKSTSSHDPPNTQGTTASAGCPNEKGTSSDPSSQQGTSSTDTPSYPSTSNSKLSDISSQSDQTEDPQTLQSSPASDTVFIPRSRLTAKTKYFYKKKRTKTKRETPPSAPRKKSQSQKRRLAIKIRLQKKISRKKDSRKQPPSYDNTRTLRDTDKQVHRQTLHFGNTQAASQKKKKRRRHRRLSARSEEEAEPLPNSDDSGSKRDADGHESGSSEVKSKPPNRIKRHRTRTPQYGVPRYLEQDTQSSDSDSVSEDKSWTTPTQETDPTTYNSVGDHLFHLSCIFLAHLVYVSSAMYIKMMLHTSM